MLLYGSSFVFLVDPSILRVVLRIYFSGLFLLLAFIGDRCCRNRAMLRLTKQSKARLTMMTGWLTAFSAVKIWIAQRQLPAGFLGIVMIVAQLMSFGADLLVSAQVKQIGVPGRCPFGVGAVLPVEPVGWRSVPSPFQPARTLVSEAQAASLQNGGLSGIFRKVNGAPNFRAEVQDVVGNWHCEDINDDITYSGHTGAQTVIDDLTSKGYLYNYSSSQVGYYPDGGWWKFFCWSPSVRDHANQTWDVRAALAIDNPRSEDRHIVRSYHCTMNGPSVEWVLRLIDASMTLRQWSAVVYGYINYDGLDEIPSQLESNLEAMVMLGYGGGVDSNATAIGDQTQGCVIAYAEIPWPLCVFLLLATLATMLMLAYWLFSSIYLRRLQSRSSYARSINGKIPNGLHGWMIQAVSEHTQHLTGDTITAKDISLWNLGPDGKGRLTVQQAAPAAPAARGMLEDKVLW